MYMKFVIAGKVEGFSMANAKVLGYYRDPKPTVESLRAEGYTQFIFAEQMGYEYTLSNGKVLSRWQD